MRGQIVVLALFLAGWSVWAADAGKWKPGLQQGVPTADGFNIDLFIPDAYAQQPEQRFPLLYMNAPNGKPKVKAFTDWANKMSVVLLGINGAQNGPWEPIVARQKAAVAFAEKELRISDCLRFSMGMSGGAQMSWLLCTTYPDKHAGILMMGQAGLSKAPPKHVAVAFIHGDKEPNNPFIATAMKKLERAGNPLREMVRPGGHISGSHADQIEMLNWMVTLERYTHPNRSKEEVEWAKAEAAKRIEGLNAISDPGARFKEARELFAIPNIGTWPEGKSLASAWFKAGLEKSAGISDNVAKHEFLSDISNDANLKLVPSAEARTLTTTLAELRRDPAIRKEYEADNILQKIIKFEAQAKNKTAWQQVLGGYTAVQKRFPGTRAAAKAEEGIRRAEANINPPRR